MQDTAPLSFDKTGQCRHASNSPSCGMATDGNACRRGTRAFRHQVYWSGQTAQWTFGLEGDGSLYGIVPKRSCDVASGDFAMLGANVFRCTLCARPVAANDAQHRVRLAQVRFLQTTRAACRC